MIEFNEDEKALIARLSVAGGWDKDEAAPIKKKIKDHFLEQGISQCCYCGLTMSRWHRITIDTEHVLPKGKFPQYTFDARNLNISCKRCNMTIKGEKISFYIGSQQEQNPFQSELYTFIHPNYDLRKEHMEITVFQKDDNLYLKYRIIPDSHKGSETYNFFKLKELEVNTFDAAQGRNTPNLEDLPPKIAQELQSIMNEKGEI